MSTSIEANVAEVTLQVLGSLTRHYPLLKHASEGSDLLQRCNAYFQQFSSEHPLSSEDDAARVSVLFDLAALTDDPSAPVFMIGGFLSRCEELSGRITPALVRERAMRDMAAVSRQMVVEAVARAEDARLRDHSTGLPNRDGAYQHLNTLLTGSDAPGNLAVLCINIRHIVEGGGISGHTSQEALVRELGKRLEGGVRERDLVSRSGPLQFHVLLPNLRHPAQSLIAANQLHALLRSPLEMDALTVLVVPTIGIANFPAHGTTPEDLLDHATLAAAEAARVSEPFIEFTPALVEVPAVNNDMARELLEAIGTNDLLLFYQPQLDLASGKVLSAEALLRWKRKNGNWTTPDLTLLMTDALGEMGRLSDYIVKAAILQMAEWRKLGLDIAVAVNLPANLLKPELPTLLESMLRSWDMPPGQLKIEITEGSMIRFGSDMEAARKVLQSLKDVGIRLAIDDFGTGYSSLAWLRMLPLDELKIDQMFVRHLADSPKDRIIVTSLVQLAHDLGLGVVVEGVEDQATLDLLTHLQCERLQGYLFSRPLAPKDFLDFVRARP